MSTSSLLFELATEEIPAAYQKNLVADWEKRLPQLIKATGLKHDAITVFGTARRIAFVATAIAERGEDITETLQGPAKSVALDANGQPTPALVGFAKKAGIAPENVTFHAGPKGEYASATVTHAGKTLRGSLPKLLHTLISESRFPRSMRWADLPTIYARPVAGYFLQYGKTKWDLSREEVKDTLLEHLPFRPVRGHFILDKNPLAIADAADYASTLAAHEIIASPAARRDKILTLLNTAAAQEKLELIANNALLDEVNYLVERPAVVVGSFSPDYLRLPDGVILSEMNQHQRYFGLREKGSNGTGKLSNRFLIVANADISGKNTVENIRGGNERVLRARLSDGAFFFDEDLKRPLGDRVADLSQIVFHDGLKTYLEKTQRIASFAAMFAQGKIAEPVLKKTAELIKADLTTALVYEFDHLQGEIGAVYAARAGESAEVCTAIQEHYLPRFQGDALPGSLLGAVMSLSDKWDNIVAAFVLGKEPTASQDPFAIRRQTLYFIQILVSHKISAPLGELIDSSLKIFSAMKSVPPAEMAEIKNKIVQFFKGRLVTIFESEGFDKKLTRAAIFSHSDDAFDLYARASALKDIAEKDRARFDALLTAFKRMANINGAATGSPDKALFSDEAEHALLAFAAELHKLGAQKTADPLLHYRTIFSAFAAGKETVDAFFDNVMVNHEDAKIRANRQALLAYALSAVNTLLDLEQLS